MATHFELAPTAYRNYNAIQYQLYIYEKDRAALGKVTRHAQPFVYYIYQQAIKRGMPAEIALIPIIESEYDPYAQSQKSAVGLWQLRQQAAHDFGLKITASYDGRRDVVAATKTALDYFEWLHDEFKDWSLAIAAYNSGPGVVMNAIRYNRQRGLPTDFWHLALPYQTRSYLPKLYALSLMIKNPLHYRLALASTPNQRYFASFPLKKSVSLKQIAALSHTDLETIRLLNAGFRSQDKPLSQVQVLVPVNKAALFVANLETKITFNKQKLLPHWVKKGESLYQLAVDFHSTIPAIRRVNHLKGTFLRIGQKLLIPKEVVLVT